MISLFGSLVNKRGFINIIILFVEISFLEALPDKPYISRIIQAKPFIEALLKMSPGKT